MPFESTCAPGDPVASSPSGGQRTMNCHPGRSGVCRAVSVDLYTATGESVNSGYLIYLEQTYLPAKTETRVLGNC